MSRQTLTGWGRATASAADVVGPEDRAELAAVCRSAHRGLIARGLGRSYGDAAQNAGRVVVSTAGLTSTPELDPRSGEVIVEAGTSIAAVLERVVPVGWMLPVVPGTRHVTVGGAIAADIHGKNHHLRGSIGSHLAWLDLVGADGVTTRIGPDERPDLFWATVGGMGLTGVIARACLRLIPIAGTELAVREWRTTDLDATFGALEAADRDHEYSVAWVDLANPKRAGRGVISVGDHVAGGSTVGIRTEPARVTTPRFPMSAVRAATVAAFNSLWWRRASVLPATTRAGFGRFFFPLDAIERWPRLYGPTGFVQWQMAVPPVAVDVVRSVAGRIAAHRALAGLAVLKRFGAADPAPLSFPIPGWTLAVDLPVGDADVAALLDELDDLVAASGGRIYLAKDARMRPEQLADMYPRLGEWRAVRDASDPDGRFTSDLGRRLGLVAQDPGPN